MPPRSRFRRPQGVPIYDCTAGALMRAVHDLPFEDAPRLLFADWLTENGHADAAEYLRACLGRPSETDSSPGRLVALQSAYLSTLVMPKPRGMHYVGIERGLPRVAAVYPADDLDYCADRMPPHYCVQLVLGHVRHTDYQPALRHPIMARFITSKCTPLTSTTSSHSPTPGVLTGRSG